MNEDLWVFGYGSLMWRPGFEFAERWQATMHGVHRRLCIYSHVHRGTPERPGMVLGLDVGGSCRGMGYRVEAQQSDDVIAYLRAREQVTMVYREARRDMVVHKPGGAERVNALVYLVDRTHPQYAGKRSAGDLLPFVLQGQGQGGACIDYIRSTLQHLDELGMKDQHLLDVYSLAVAAQRQRA